MTSLTTFVVILVVVAIHHYLVFNTQTWRFSYITYYVEFMSAKLASLFGANRWVTLCLLVLPVVIIVVLLGALIYGLFSILGYMIFSGALLWFCVDFESNNSASLQELLSCRLKYLFAPLFWYMLLGLFGLTLYVMTRAMTRLGQVESAPKELAGVILSFFDWLPERAVGIALALVGHFNKTFPVWLGRLLQKPTMGNDYLWACMAASLGAADNALTQDKDSIENIVTMLLRVLLVWLVVFGLLAIGAWLG